MIFSIAWKNVWRNKLRSSIVIASITVGLLGGIFYLAFANGMAIQQVNSGIKTEVSNIQIHNPKFLINDEINFTIKNPEQILSQIKKMDEVKEATTRITSPAMISSAITGTGIFIKGIDVERERRTTNLFSFIFEGEYFNNTLRNQIVIGEKLATKLKVKIHSKVVITIQSANGNITYEAFKVVGIYKTHNTNFDQQMVFMKKKTLARVLGIDKGSATEIAILLKQNKSTDEVANRIEEIYKNEISKKEIIVQTWEELQPALKMINEITTQFSMIFVIIILVALSFGIINTMLMAIMERIREIGMLMAIGMKKSQLFLMILLETVLLSFTGGVLGLFVSWLVVTITNKTGIDLSSIADGLNSMGYSSFVYPELDFIYYILIALLVIVTAIFASVMPARKAIKFNPAEAVRHDA